MPQPSKHTRSNAWRINLTQADIVRELVRAEELSLTQLCGLFSTVISPENAIRRFRLFGLPRGIRLEDMPAIKVPIDEAIARGTRCAIAQVVNRAIRDKKVVRRKDGKETRYRLTQHGKEWWDGQQEAKARKHTPGRRHAAKGADRP